MKSYLFHCAKTSQTPHIPLFFLSVAELFSSEEETSLTLQLPLPFSRLVTLCGRIVLNTGEERVCAFMVAVVSSGRCH